MLTKDQWLIVALAFGSGTGGSFVQSAVTDSKMSESDVRVIYQDMDRAKDVKLDALLQQVHQMRVDTEVMKAQVVDMREYLQQRFGWAAKNARG